MMRVVKSLVLLWVLWVPSTVQSLELHPYVQLGAGSYQLDLDVNTFGSASSTLMGGYAGLGMDFDWGEDYTMGIQFRAGASNTSDTKISSVSVATQINFPLFGVYLTPRYRFNDDWNISAYIGVSESPNYALSYGSGATDSSISKSPLSYGVAVQYVIDDQLYAGLEWMNYQSAGDVAANAATPVKASLSGIAFTLSYAWTLGHQDKPEIRVEHAEEVVMADLTSPVLHVLGASKMKHIRGTVYIDQGGRAIDDEDGDLSSLVQVSGQVNSAATGYYTLQYDVQDKAGNKAIPEWREVQVIFDPLVKEMIASKFVHFPSNSSYFKKSYEINMETIVSIMQQYPVVKIEILAHADSLESENYNVWLAERRAERVLNYLIGHGIDASRLVYQVKGETQPRSDNLSEDGRTSNRRVEFRLSNEKAINAGNM